MSTVYHEPVQELSVFAHIIIQTVDGQLNPKSDAWTRLLFKNPTRP